jgi:hypothetical protein
MGNKGERNTNTFWVHEFMMVYLGNKEIVRNARVNGAYGPEEKHGGNPLTKVRRFEIQILVEAQHYTVRKQSTNATVRQTMLRNKITN